MFLVRSEVMMSVRVIFAPVVSSVLVAFFSTVMGMAPQGDFFQGEKTQDTSEQDREGFVRRQSFVPALQATDAAEPWTAAGRSRS